MAKLPLYKIVVEDGDALDFLSFVREPATQQSMLAFNEDNKPSKQIQLSEEGDRRIILSVVMMPDVPIYRRDDSGYEYEIVFDKKTIEKMARNFFKRHRQENFDTDHNYNWVSGVTVFQSLIIDSQLGISAPSGFDNLPEGTWLIAATIDNNDLWYSIKEGKYTGLSLAGSFGLEQLKMSKDKSDEELIEEMKDMYKNLCKL